MVAELRTELVSAEPAQDYSAVYERNRRRRDQTITITREQRGVWRVSGGAVERMVVQTDWDNDEAISYLQHRFDRIGLDDLLAKHGAQPGDEVRILGYAFAYEGDVDDEYAELSDDDDALIEEDE